MLVPLVVYWLFWATWQKLTSATFFRWLKSHAWRLTENPFQDNLRWWEGLFNRALQGLNTQNYLSNIINWRHYITLIISLSFGGDVKCFDREPNCSQPQLYKKRRHTIPHVNTHRVVEKSEWTPRAREALRRTWAQVRRWWRWCQLVTQTQRGAVTLAHGENERSSVGLNCKLASVSRPTAED